MKILQLKESERIKEGLRSLTEEFIEEYPYYSTWIEKNEATFKDRTRVVYELNDNEKTVGYMMVHFSTAKCANINCNIKCRTFCNKITKIFTMRFSSFLNSIYTQT